MKHLNPFLTTFLMNDIELFSRLFVKQAEEFIKLSVYKASA